MEERGEEDGEQEEEGRGAREGWLLEATGAGEAGALAELLRGSREAATSRRRGR